MTTNNAAPKLAPIQIIGLDCDDPHALEKCMRRDPKILRNADIICGAESSLDTLRHDPDLKGRLLKLCPPLEPLYDSLFDLSQQGFRVVVLADGDPLFFGIGSSLVSRASNQPIRIIPAVSTLQAACARLQIPWHNVYCLSLHGRKDLAPLYDAVASGHTICILTGGRATPDALASLLLDRGVDWFEAHIFERMGRSDEVRMTLSLKDCAQSHFGGAPTMLLIPGEKPRAPSLGLEESRFLGNYPIKRPVRGAILEMLKIAPTDTVWDIGAGSGILALEACVLAHEGRVIAIERNVERCLDIQENRRLLGAVNLDIKTGAAPEAFSELPQPDRIFMWEETGSDKAMEILRACADALPRGGRLAVGSLLLAAFGTCRKFMESLGWPVEMMQVQASNAAPQENGGDFAPSNPVLLLAARKP